jgi:outer membrane protein W
MKFPKVMVLVLLSFLAALPMRLDAAKGFYVSTGTGASFPVMSGDFIKDANPQDGDALEIDLGYGFDKNWALGFKWGLGEGPADENYLGNSASWQQFYTGIYGRYSFDKDQKFVPYIDAGIGSYFFDANSDDLDLFTDNEAVGFNIDVGGNYFIGRSGRLYIGPELSYHYAYFNTQAKVEPDYYRDFRIDFKDNTGMILLLLKIGYQWKPRTTVHQPFPAP